MDYERGLQERIECLVTNGLGYSERIPQIIKWWEDSEIKLQTSLFYMDVSDGKEKVLETENLNERLNDIYRLFEKIGKFEKSLSRDNVNHF